MIGGCISEEFDVGAGTAPMKYYLPAARYEE